ncbi:MAG: ADP-ribosyltransferase [Propionibacteriaceae bacterium]|nr:ADP-ribosyltransferase [Propionibacteriaceae bacterium]
MGAKYQGAPEFTIQGNPTSIYERTSMMRQRASDFTTLGESLSSLSTDGWTGRAAERFRERFEVEPNRWTNAATEFQQAANTLDAYAETLASAQSAAQVCKANYDEGNRQTEAAKAQYDKEVEEGYRRKEQWEAQNGPGTFTLTITPFQDPGKELRDKATSDFASLIANLEKQAAATATEVRAACDGADAARNWFESGLAFLGGIIVGAGEAIWDLGELLLSIQYGPLMDLYKILSGELTLEEWATKAQLSLETAGQVFEAFKKDPFTFGANVLEAILDVDTWKDDPARAIGHLLPDVLAAVFTGGTGTAATRGAKIVDGIDDVGDAVRAADRTTDAARAADTAADLARGADALDDASDVRRLSNIDFSMGNAAENPKGFEGWLDEFTAKNPGVSREAVEAVHRYTGNDYDAINSALRRGGDIPADISDTIRKAEQGLDQLPTTPGITMRGTTLPQTMLDDMIRTGKFSDPAFLSTTSDPNVARQFLESSRKLDPDGVPTILEVSGRNGVDVSRISQFGHEAETLFKPGTQFDIVETLMEDGIMRMKLKES